MSNKKITVTKPSVPDLEEFIPYLESIWEDRWLTNNGKFHQQLEKELELFLGVDHIALCSNGTLALMLALKALEVKGEVITTPFSFVATSHAITWDACTPVFADIDPKTFNLDPEKIESLINEKTTAIMPVHVYGNPCDNEKLQNIAEKHGLKLIYDAAHAFHVKKDGKSILNWGDMSVLSFHATKVFNTFEGGAVVCHTPEMKKKINDLKNFGFQNETTVLDVGINAKMNEVQAAMGLAQIKHVTKMIEKRKKLAELYRRGFSTINGIEIPEVTDSVESNYAYFPILINEDFGIPRDELYEKLKEHNIFARRYFYPLISSFPMYKDLSSAQASNLSVASEISSKILCLPLYPDLLENDIERIVLLINNIK